MTPSQGEGIILGENTPAGRTMGIREIPKKWRQVWGNSNNRMATRMVALSCALEPIVERLRVVGIACPPPPHP
jgi:hypothetical protein